MSQIIIDKDKEIEELKLKKNELKNNSIDSQKEIKQKNDITIQNLKQELSDINKSIDNLKNEILKKEQIIDELNKRIKGYDEKEMKEIEEKKILKEENDELKKKIEEFKNSLI